MVALPTQLFRTTGIPVCLWFFAKDKTAGQARLGRPRRAGALHRRPQLGHMVDRAERALSDDDIARIADTYHAWRGTTSAAERADVRGRGRLLQVRDARRDQGRRLRPDARAVRGRRRRRGRRRTLDDKIERLTKELFDAVRRVGAPGRGSPRAVGAGRSDRALPPASVSSSRLGRARVLATDTANARSLTAAVFGSLRVADIDHGFGSTDGTDFVAESGDVAIGRRSVSLATCS